MRELIEAIRDFWGGFLDGLLGRPFECRHPATPVPPVFGGIWPTDTFDPPRALLTCGLCGSSYNARVSQRALSQIGEPLPVAHALMGTAEPSATSTAEIRGG